MPTAALRRACLMALIALTAGLNEPALAEDRPVVVFAAASLKTALDDAAMPWRTQGSPAARISYAASSALARQIEAGAPADVFISADTEWMDWLADRKLIRPETRRDLLGNRIVLVAPQASTVSAAIAPGFPLAALLGEGRLAMAETRSVPAGKYGKAALTALGVWPSVERRIAQAENVRAALRLVSRGEAPLGIVYLTDATAEPGVRIVDTFPAATHPPIVYPVAVTTASTNAAAGTFVAFLRSEAAKPSFAKQGFALLE